MGNNFPVDYHAVIYNTIHTPDPPINLKTNLLKVCWVLSSVCTVLAGQDRMISWVLDCAWAGCSPFLLDLHHNHIPRLCSLHFPQPISWQHNNSISNIPTLLILFPCIVIQVLHDFNIFPVDLCFPSLTDFVESVALFRTQATREHGLLFDFLCVTII